MTLMLLIKKLAGIFYPSRVFMGAEILTTAKVSVEIVPVWTGTWTVLLRLTASSASLTRSYQLWPRPRLSAPPSCVILDMSCGVPPPRLRGAARACPWNIISLFGDVRKRADGSWWDGLLRRAGGGRFPLRRAMEPDQICHLFFARPSAQSPFGRDGTQV